jgi:prolyl-tRNA editing enzyme YbaK/EbsC (Cys-tRNA(Pro) deacylase)
MTDLSPHNARVAAALNGAGATAAADGIRRFADSTRTAADAAAALGVPIGAIVKSLVFTADGEPVLVLASGDHQVDVGKVATALGATTVRRADPDVVRTATGFVIGGVAPVGHPQPLRTVVDAHLATYPVLWAAAGTSDSVFPTDFDELVRVTGGTPTDVAAA